jgi:hypothetical protein
LAWVWYEQIHLGINQEPIKCHLEGAWVSLMLSKQAQIHFSWNSSLEGEVMSWMLMLWFSFI